MPWCRAGEYRETRETVIAGRVEPWNRWVSRDGRLHGLGEGTDRGRPTAVPASRARVSLCEAQEGMGSTAVMYRS
jgi:hypothetical protein